MKVLVLMLSCRYNKGSILYQYLKKELSYKGKILVDGLPHEYLPMVQKRIKSEDIT